MLTETIKLYIGRYGDFDSRNTTELLSFEEKYKYNYYQYDVDRNKFLQRHIELRRVLLSNNIGESILSYSDLGQPILQNINDQQNSWNISLSSAEQRFTILISSNRVIGVDIEYIREIDLSNSLIDLIFHPNEKIWYYSIPPYARTNYFYTLWTGKEAYVKATGTGLLSDLTSIELQKIKEKHYLGYSVSKNYLISYCILDKKN